MAVRSQEILEPFATESVLRKRHGFRAEGTARMIAGSLAGALGAYLFVVVGGRRLGTVQFAPIALLWTVFFIVATVVLIPLEQFVTREVGRGRRVLVADRRVLVTVIGGTGIALAAFVALTNEALFGGHPIFILQAFLLTGLFGLMQVGKGILAGQRRFAAYGLVLTLEGVFRLVAAVALLALAPSAAALGWAMVCAPLCILAARPWRHDRTTDPEVSPTPAAGFLGNYVIGSAASQLLLAGGPLGVVVLGGDAALRSVIFTTFTLYRAPLTLIYNLQGRVLSFLVRSNGNGVDVSRLITRIALIGVGLGSLAGLVGWLVGPALVELLFGPDFRPQAAVAALVAAGVIVASATQIMAQALVASGSTRQLAGAWVGGLLAGVAAMLVWGGGPGLRVGVGFLVGELTAFVLALIRTAGSR
jgi:O-antigen/teichoic acid export membrane protein